LAFRDPSGVPLEPRILVDNKDKAVVAESDIAKLVRDAKERSTPVAILVAREESQLRSVDKESRWACKDGIWILRTTRQWVPRDLEMLRPVFERLHVEGVGFLNKNVALAAEIRRSLSDLDGIENELKKAARTIQSVSALVAKYRERVHALCKQASASKMPPKPDAAIDGRKGLAG